MLKATDNGLPDAGRRSAAESRGDAPETRLRLYRSVYLIRTTEEEIRRLYPTDEMKTPVHLSNGQEAIAAGVCHALKPDGQVFASYRSHGCYLAWSGETDGFFAEMFGRGTAAAKGKAGSMHLSAPDRGFMASSAVVGTPIPVAVGCAFANKVHGNGRFVAVFFGDGATEEGVFWESLNFACLRRLPILFVCEDNDLAIHAKGASRRGYDSLTRIVENFHCHVVDATTTDAEEIAALAATAMARYREAERPTVFRFRCYRYLEHVGINPDFDAGYRSEEEYHEWLAVDPVSLLRDKLIAGGVAEPVIRELEAAVRGQIDDSVAKARRAPFPDGDELYRDVYS